MSIVENIEEVRLDEKAKVEYKRYGVHTIEDRAIFGEIDGLKPVARRLVWAAHKMGLKHNTPFTKAMKVIGETMGNYHPHGDAAINGALVTAVNQAEPLFEGSGNWGTMTENAAAPRYIECRLSKYADKIFLDPFYIPVNYMVDNYDASTKEPLILTSLMPNTLLNGNFGIAPGVRTQTPTYTMVSLTKVLVKSLVAGECNPKMCLPLKFTTELGGVLHTEDKEVRKELLRFYKTGKGKFVFDSSYTEHGNTIRIDKFAPVSNIAGILTKISNIAGVVNVRDDSSIKDRYNAYQVEFKKGLKGKELESTIAKVMDAFSSGVSFNIQVVEREPDGKGGSRKALRPATVPSVINTWIDYRVELEKKACSYWIEKHKVEIAYLQLLRLAVKNRRFIIKALDKKLDDEQLAKYIAKGLKITVDQANQILDLKIRQLKALEDKVLVGKIKKLNDEVKSYKVRIKKPKKFIAKQLIELCKELK